MSLVIQPRRDERRVPPWQVADAVQHWARDHGLPGGRMVWHPQMECWVIEFPFRDGDPRLAAHQNGDWYGPPVEAVPLQQQSETGHLVALDIEELGVDGVISFLDAGNLLSGTGQYPDLLSACQAAQENNRQASERRKKEIEDLAWDIAHENRRRDLGIQQANVPEQLES